mmetsp:Transcript_38186/g.70985  ORF Transcript_38186/g.70985 Transcript_38186/m.70985 type:complete len:193 (+) Transcript_38186:120-698(+)
MGVKPQTESFASQPATSAVSSDSAVPSDGSLRRLCIPGSYVLLQPTVVLPKCEVACGAVPQVVIGQLSAGAVVDVVEVVLQLEDNRVRGRLQFPDGWISLVNLETGYRWAVPRFPMHNAAALLPGSFWPGQQVEYNSTTAGAWIVSSVAAVDADGAVQLNCKLGYWMPRGEQLQKLRCPIVTLADAAAFGLC